jgi:hypothetical protein
LEAVISIEKNGCNAADQDAAEHAGLDRRDAHDGARLVIEQRRHHTHGCNQYSVTNDGSEGGNAVVVSDAERHADRKDERQIPEDGAARLRHNRRNNFGQPRELRAAHPEQQARGG